MSQSKPLVTYEQFVSDLEACDPIQRAHFIKKNLRHKEHLHIFGRYFFPKIIKGNYTTPEAHLELISEITSKKDSAIIFPRGHAKSTWTKIDCLHDIVYGLEPLIIYVSDTATKAQRQFEAIKSELESNDILRSIFGNLVPANGITGRKWTNDEFHTTNGIIAICFGRLQGRGVNILNERPTKIIVDDVEDDQQVSSADQRMKLHNWLYNVLFPSLDPEKGRIKMIGTVLSDISELRAFYGAHGGILRRAIENGKPIWSERWSIEKLNSERERIGTRAFNREYMNNPSSDDESMINPTWMARDEYVMLPEGKEWKVVAFIDPQSGESAMSDEYAITVLYCIRNTVQRYVVEQVAGRKSQIEQAKDVVRVWLRHKKHIQLFGVEKLMTQTAVWQVLQDWKAGRISFNPADITMLHADWINESDRGIPIVECSPEGKDKVARLQMFEADFERGEIHLRPEMTEARHQLAFTVGKSGEHDDRADSIIGALELASKFGLVATNLSNERKDMYTLERSTVGGNIRSMRF